MKKTPALAAALILVAATATACGATGSSESSGSDAQNWYAQNCPLQTTDIRESVIQGKPGGAVVGTAIVQGPINSPAALDGSTESIGLYSQDKVSGEMQEQAKLTSSDTFCLDPTLQTDASQRFDIPETQESFTLMRSPKYPEGIWVGVHMSDLPKGFSVDDSITEKCDMSWWPNMEISTLEGAGKADVKIAKYALTTFSDC